MAELTRKKVPLSTSVSPKIGKRFDEAMNTGEYSSQSDLLQIALTEYFTHEEIRQHQTKLIEIYERLLNDDEGSKLLQSIPQDKSTQIEALRSKGIACVELGDLEGARNCFRKAKELEGNNPKTQGSKRNRTVIIENGIIQNEDTEL